MYLRPMRMSEPRSFFRIFTRRSPLMAAALLVLLAIGGPASAQFFGFGNFGGPPRSAPRGGGWFGGDLFAPFQQQQQQPKRVENFSKAPPPEKRETIPERNILVLGD